MIEVINKYNIKAKKSLWQNFLIDENILNNISSLTNIYWENIVEIWPWFWVLTEKIIKKNPSSLTLIELDKDMINIINERIKLNEINLSETWNFKIINQDILKTKIEFNDYKIIANIPYYITSPILFKFLYEEQNKPKTMIILMQKEVWEKIISKDNSFLSLYIKKKSNVSLEIPVKKEYFYPSPKVDSVVLKFEVKEDNSEIDDKIYLDFLKLAFSSPRKKLISNLWIKYDKNKILHLLQKKGLSENSRPQELWLDEYIYLIKNLI